MDTLEALRTAFAAASGQPPVDAMRKQSSTIPSTDGTAEQVHNVELLHTISQTGSSVEMDTLFAVTPLGNGASRAAYWVHQDNIVNIQILLLRYTSQKKEDDHDSSTASPTSPRSSSKGSVADLQSTNHRWWPNNDVGTIICDDLRNFAKRRSSETVEDIETSSGLASEKAIASIRFSTSSDPIVAVVATVKTKSRKSSPEHHFLTTKLSRKEIRRWFGTADREIKANVDTDRNKKGLLRWLADHREIMPLAKIQCRRLRFLGLRNSPKGGVWATLDVDVHMRQCSSDQMAADKSLLSADQDTRHHFHRFPHAVLEIRVEGNGSNALVKSLDASHLVGLALFSVACFHFDNLLRRKEFADSLLKLML